MQLAVGIYFAVTSFMYVCSLDCKDELVVNSTTLGDLLGSNSFVQHSYVILKRKTDGGQSR